MYFIFPHSQFYCSNIASYFYKEISILSSRQVATFKHHFPLRIISLFQGMLQCAWTGTFFFPQERWLLITHSILGRKRVFWRKDCMIEQRARKTYMSSQRNTAEECSMFCRGTASLKGSTLSLCSLLLSSFVYLLNLFERMCTYLVGGLEHFSFFHISGIIIPID